MKYRFLAILLCLVMLLGLLPTTAFAAETVPTANVTISDDGFLYWEPVEGAFCYEFSFGINYYVCSYDVATGSFDFYENMSGMPEGDYTLSMVFYNENSETVAQWSSSYHYIPFSAYRVSVNGTLVTESNRNDILCDGTASFTPPEADTPGKLTLNNYDGGRIFSDRDLDIALVGYNTITATNSHAIEVHGACTMTGDGSLNVNAVPAEFWNGIATEGDITLDMNGNLQVSAPASIGIYSFNGIITLAGGGNITVIGGEYGIWANLQMVNVRSKGMLNLKSQIHYPLAGLRGLTISSEDIRIITPAGGTVKRLDTPMAWTIADQNGEGVKHVVLMPFTEFPLWVNDTRVTTDNMNDIFGDGTASYTPAIDTDRGTLTLHDYNGRGIRSNSPLYIDVQGTNRIYVDEETQQNGIYTDGFCDLIGDGDLSIHTEHYWYDAVLAERGNLTVSMSGNLEVYSNSYGLNAAKNNIIFDGSGRVTVNAEYIGLNAEYGAISYKGSGKVDVTSRLSWAVCSGFKIGLTRNHRITTPSAGFIEALYGKYSVFDSVGALNAETPSKHVVVEYQTPICTHPQMQTFSAAPSTCARCGNDAYKTCLDCGMIFDMNGKELPGVPLRDVDPANHEALSEWKTDEIDHWRDCAGCNKTKLDRAMHTLGLWVIDTPATESSAGQKHKDCTVCHRVLVTVTIPPASSHFVDVPKGSYYEDAVSWAVENEITTGMDATHFAPEASCTRAQAVTFLWRAAGCPAPSSSKMPFKDVKAGSYYYDAVLWAVEKGVTNGTTDTTFSPEDNCSRAQIVTFLWRSQNSPAAGSSNPFTDVKPTAYYADAVLWAVKEAITNGTTAATFSPEDNCTRAQIVTFIYRALSSRG